jgi:cytidylate kinase
MPLIIISSSSYDCRKELAESLAKKSGYLGLSREELVEEATGNGIPVGKLEVATLKAPVMKERLARLKTGYLAFITASMCERMKNGNLIYHGRAGHLLLPGVSHVFRVRVLPEKEYYVKEVMRRLKMSREKTMEYIEQVDKDVDNWVRIVHGVDPNDSAQYDMVINLEKMSLSNASAALCAMIDLPDFHPTPASLRIMENHRLAAQARVRIALDERLSGADVNVMADHGVITVTYMPRQAHVAGIVPEILKDIEGCREIFCTMAQTNILWIQERYDPDSEVFHQITQVAKKWGAAIELLRWVPSDSGEDPGWGEDIGKSQESARKDEIMENVDKVDDTGGIEDDVEEASSGDQGGIALAEERLVNVGQSGGSRTAGGTTAQLIASISRDVKYSMVVIGNVYLSRPHAVQMRMSRDLRRFLQDRLNLPVIETNDLGEKLLFGKKQLIKLLIFLALVVVIYTLVFSYQGPILKLFGGEIHERLPWLTPLAVIAFVPLIAYLYSTVTGLILKLIRLE